MSSLEEALSAADFMPVERSLAAARTAAAACHGCELYRQATQTVFGEGPERARVMLVGEQPGDHEDRAGRPFIGAAGQLLERCLEAAGLARAKVYLTNAVKHFRWTPNGKRRLHARPLGGQIHRCRPWLELELELVRPLALMTLGATAAASLFGRDFKLAAGRGVVAGSPLAPLVMASVHPSSILRESDTAQRRAATDRFVAELARLAAAAHVA